MFRLEAFNSAVRCWQHTHPLTARGLLRHARQLPHHQRACVPLSRLCPLTCKSLQVLGIGTLNCSDSVVSSLLILDHCVDVSPPREMSFICFSICDAEFRTVWRLASACFLFSKALSIPSV